MNGQTHRIINTENFTVDIVDGSTCTINIVDSKNITLNISDCRDFSVNITDSASYSIMEKNAVTSPLPAPFQPDNGTTEMKNLLD